MNNTRRKHVRAALASLAGAAPCLASAARQLHAAAEQELDYAAALPAALQGGARQCASESAAECMQLLAYAVEALDLPAGISAVEACL